MDKSQSEVTDKIRSAIKEKLIQINLFVDDELPDYIMILIANKRSKHHMEKDLSLFLGSQTTEFTNWLCDLVNSFKDGAKTRTAKGSEVKTSNSFETRADEDDVLNYDPAEQGETLCQEEINETVENKSSNEGDSGIIQTANSSNHMLLEKPKSLPLAVKTELPVVVPDLCANVENVKTLPIPTIKSETENSNNAPAIESTSQTKVSQKSAKVYPMQRPSQLNVEERQNNPVNVCNSSESDHIIGVSSVVCITQRKYGGPAALQANKLLLRAVKDATKSVLNGKDINDYYKPTPIKELKSNKIKESDIKQEDIVSELRNPLSNAVNEDFNLVANKNLNINTSVINKEPQLTRHIIRLPEMRSDVEMFDDSNHSVLNFHQSPQLEEEIPSTPHFIVTLDGVNFSSLKRKFSDDESMDINDDEEDNSEEFENHANGKKQKLAERCKYWPACRNSDGCEYHHPTIPCKCFPSCKFGDKCLYIHPNCKFDSLCSRKDCPYTHCSKRQFHSIPTSLVKPMKIPTSKTVCKYYPKCTAKLCPFIHPKLCRFGTQCRALKCAYGHFQIPQRNLLKWKANSS